MLTDLCIHSRTKAKQLGWSAVVPVHLAGNELDDEIYGNQSLAFPRFTTANLSNARDPVNGENKIYWVHLFLAYVFVAWSLFLINYHYKVPPLPTRFLPGVRQGDVKGVLVPVGPDGGHAGCACLRGRMCATNAVVQGSDPVLCVAAVLTLTSKGNAHPASGELGGKSRAAAGHEEAQAVAPVSWGEPPQQRAAGHKPSTWRGRRWRDRDGLVCRS